jgi:recombinational DNA repair protein RecT
MRSDKVKKIWCEVVYEDDDFEYELGLEPKLMHIPNHDAIRNSATLKFIYACAKLQDEVIFKVMSKKEIQNIVNMSKFPNDLYFNDKKDSEQWMAKKTVLKQLSKLMPKDDDRLKKGEIKITVIATGFPSDMNRKTSFGVSVNQSQPQSQPQVTTSTGFFGRKQVIEEKPEQKEIPQPQNDYLKRFDSVEIEEVEDDDDDSDEFSALPAFIRRQKK